MIHVLGLGSCDREVSVTVKVVDTVTVPVSGHWVLAAWSAWHTVALLCLSGQWLMVWIWLWVVRCNLDWRLEKLC